MHLFHTLLQLMIKMYSAYFTFSTSCTHSEKRKVKKQHHWQTFHCQKLKSKKSKSQHLHGAERENRQIAVHCWKGAVTYPFSPASPFPHVSLLPVLALRTLASGITLKKSDTLQFMEKACCIHKCIVEWRWVEE